jgi:hypothetical protein
MHMTQCQLAKSHDLLWARAHCAGRRFIRPFMPDQHREFYAELVSPGKVDGPHGIAAVCASSCFLPCRPSCQPKAAVGGVASVLQRDDGAALACT